MEQNPSLVISREDYQKISTLLSVAQTDIADLLEEELGRAELVEAAEIPKDTVSMNDKVSFVDLDSGKEQEVTLVYPLDADINGNKVSILAPVGAALIGLKVGQIIHWPLGSDKVKRIKVIAVQRG
ncbi:nucleoside diphosphate kinase regulator [Bdellovibrio sp. HCB209]|uniref:nucleoside diphosphate kinase regulator n=1 Tax=Bdellovibrio sp. HCB209 TaxID=3394354 RepID=UPI0039B664E3